MRRVPLVLLVGTALAATVTPGLAAPKPITQEVPYTDPTPDYSGFAVGTNSHCEGLLPREKPYVFKAPAAGRLKVTLSKFSGEWGLDLRDAKGRVLAETDVLGAQTETLTVKLRRAGEIQIAPCNLAGSTGSLISLVFTYA